MAMETRAFIFARHFELEDGIEPQTLTLPVSRTYHGTAVTSGGQQLLFVRGDWDATESVDIEYVRYNDLPIAATVIIGGASSNDEGGFAGLVIEA